MIPRLHGISLAYGSTLVTTADSDVELEVPVGEGGPEAKDGSEDDLGCDQVDSCGDTGLHRREGLRARRVKRDGYCEALVD